MEKWDIAKILLGAVLALSGGVIARFLDSKQNDLSQRVDELTKLIWEFAELSSKYWSTKQSPELLKLSEAKIAGLDHYIGANISFIIEKYPNFESNHKIQDLLNNLSDAATGGNFQVSNRRKDMARINEIYSHASLLCVGLRMARREALLHRIFRFK